MRTPIRSSCLTRSEIVCREWLAVKDLLSGSGGLGNAAARTCFGVGRRFKSNDANHDYDGNDNRNNAASAPFSIVRVIWVRDAAIVLLVRHGLIPFLDIPPSKRTVVASCIRQSRQPVGSFPQALLAKTCRQSKEETPDPWFEYVRPTPSDDLFCSRLLCRRPFLAFAAEFRSSKRPHKRGTASCSGMDI